MVTTDGGATWAARDTGAKGRLRVIAFTADAKLAWRKIEKLVPMAPGRS